MGVDGTTCRVQKFTGTQLRARVYTVHRADVTIVKPWQFESGVVYEEEEEEMFYPSADNQDSDDVVEDHIQNGNEDEDTAVAEEEKDSREIGVTTRSGRKTRLPSHLADYVVEKE